MIFVKFSLFMRQFTILQRKVALLCLLSKLGAIPVTGLIKWW